MQNARLFNAAGIIPDPTAGGNPIADFWYNNIAANFAWAGSAYRAPNPVAIANLMPHPVSVQQISRFQGQPPY